MRRRPQSLSPADRTRKPLPVDEMAVVAPKRVHPPLTEQFHVAVDRQLKSGYPTYQAAEMAALAIKRRYPLLQITVYDAKEQRHTTIEAPKVVADPHKKVARQLQSSNSHVRAIAGAKR